MSLMNYSSDDISQMSYMKTPDKQQYGLWELAVLSLLREDPMHPYEMMRILKERHKDEVLELKRGSLYHAINRLLRSGLIEVVEVARDGRRPERTTYKITPNGDLELGSWLRNMIAHTRREPSEFMAAVSFLVHLSPEDAMVQLKERARKLELEIIGLEIAIKTLVARITRVNLLESEYEKHMRQAELAWVRGLVQDLRSGELTWDLDAILNAIRAMKKHKGTSAKMEAKK